MLPDHLVDWTNPSAPWYDAWTALAALAQATSTIRLGTAVTQIPLRNPAMLARQVLTLDQISNGRIELGLGAGLTIDPSYKWAASRTGPMPSAPSASANISTLVAQLLSQETTTFAGRYYQADGAVMNPRPIQQPRPPIMVAALGPKMMRHAVRHADSWNSLSFQPSFPEQLAETRDAHRHHRPHLRRARPRPRHPATLLPHVRHHRPSQRRRHRLLPIPRRLPRPGRTPPRPRHHRPRPLLPLPPRPAHTFERIATEVLPGLRN